MMNDPLLNLTPIVWNAPSKPYHLKSVKYQEHRVPGATGRKLRPDERAYYCNLCGGIVVYTTGKSGKRYLCDAEKTNYEDKWYNYKWSLREYFPNKWHNKTCKPHGGAGIHPKVLEYIGKVKALREALTRGGA